MRRDYDGERRRQGLQVWESPDILPRGAWLERVWQECAYRDPFDTPVLLSAVQEEALWEQLIAGSSAADELLDLPHHQCVDDGGALAFGMDQDRVELDL